MTSEAATAGPQPVTVGIPLPRGQVKNQSAMRLLTDKGQAVALQTSALAHCHLTGWATFDFFCEPWIVAKMGLSVEEHQRSTLENYLELCSGRGPGLTDRVMEWIPARLRRLPYRRILP